MALKILLSLRDEEALSSFNVSPRHQGVEVDQAVQWARKAVDLVLPKMPVSDDGNIMMPIKNVRMSSRHRILPSGVVKDILCYESMAESSSY